MLYKHKYYRNISCIFGALLSILLSLQSQAATDSTAMTTLPEGITVELSLPKSSLSAADPVLLSVKFTNTSQQTVRFLKWATPFDSSVRYDMFDIYFNGSRLPYTGLRVRRLAPTDASYINLTPGQEIATTVDIQRAYSMDAAGSYRINYRDNQSQGAGSPSVTLILTQTRARALRSRQTAQYANCSAERMATLDSDLTLAEPLAKTSYQDIHNAPIEQRATAPRYREWFGIYSPQNYEEARLTIERTYRAIRDETIRFDCSCTDPETLAQVNPINHYVIEICPPYFAQNEFVSPTGSDSRVGTLFHEITHFAIVGDTDDYVYYREASLALARSSPAQAVDNADNFLFFMENNPPLSMPGPMTEPQPGSAHTIASVISLLLNESTRKYTSTRSEDIFDNLPGAAITDDIVISDNGKISDLMVTLNISHLYIGDLVVTLSHVNTGTSVVLLNNPPTCSSNDINNTLSDAASLSVQTDCSAPSDAKAYINGTKYQPSGSLSDFDGESPAGTWRLTIFDNEADFTGTRNSWSIHITK